MPRALIIRGPLSDMQDLLRIARKEGKRALGCDKVRVYPEIDKFGEHFVVFVEEEF